MSSLLAYFIFYTLCLLTNIIKSQPERNRDIGCNYINLGGIGMPMDYCMQIYLEGMGTFAMKWQCNSTYNGVSMEIYGDSSCANSAWFTQPYSEAETPFVCKKEYNDKSCSEVSLNAYTDDKCLTEYSEIRLITHECLWYGDYTYIKLSCTADSATISYYESPIGNCTDQYLLNTTALTEGELEGESAGCIEIEGCYDLGQPKDNTTAKIVGYSIMGIVIIVGIILIVVFILRYKHKKKMAHIASLSSSVIDASSSIQAGNSETHSGKTVKNPYGQLEQDDEDIVTTNVEQA